MSETVTICGVEVEAPDPKFVNNISGRPYLNVNGRLDLLRKVLVAKKFEVTDYSVLPAPAPIVPAHLVAASVILKLPWGEYVGHAASNLEATDRQKQTEVANPVEMAATSALGRALGFAGFDPYGQIESAEGMAKAGYNAGNGQQQQRPYSGGGQPQASQPSGPIPPPNDVDENDSPMYACQDCGKEIAGYTNSKTGKTYSTESLIEMSIKDTGGIYCYTHKQDHRQGRY